ncbi:NUDIX domain-containing protein [Bartonella tamiae]|uniref:GDP-mannose pyrophosphatase n=1 Tax=Bartonella tamiae Th239 TaxID=1094558 RepID=J0QTI7_9HYPH|nr:NUDIX hydrolase [Bartonella tamiae]EJF89221.1 YffH/AdpP family nudix-type nucleoside diphosphatase [Bartonella tamiae Th239]EJF95375.1 YffH/AdpP family nudix-type nucleoside diphosphatase [Bartonella tamiae Th307]
MTKIRNVENKTLSYGWRQLTATSYEQKFADGHWRKQTREVYHCQKAVVVLPFNLKTKTVVFVRQFRIPAYLEQGLTSLLEACAGMVDEKETEEQAVMREAKEELGFQLHNLDRVFEGFVTPGYATERFILYLAHYEQEDKTGFGGLLEEGEEIECIEMPIEKAFMLLDNCQINDMKTALLLTILRQKYFL